MICSDCGQRAHALTRINGNEMICSACVDYLTGLAHEMDMSLEDLLETIARR